MNKLSIQRRTQVIKALVEGNSIPATYRMNDTAKGTVTRLLVDIGTACSRYQDEHLRNLTCRRIQCDEIWSFVYAKQKNVPTGMNGFAGDAWTWVSMCDDSKLVVSWLVGLRDAGYAYELMTDLAGRLSHRVQLTTDGLKSYLSAVEGAFGSNVDYAQLVKLYGEDPTEDKRRYSPAEWIASKPNVVQGNPDPAHISTSYIERQNLTMRMSMTRFTRSTNGFSKKIENLKHAVALHFMWYNFCRPHSSLGSMTAPAGGFKLTHYRISGFIDFAPGITYAL
jgi:hypothetical protein